MKDQDLIDLEDEWYEHQSTCTCAVTHPPCSFCESGYNIPFDEWLEYQKEIRFPDVKQKEDLTEKYKEAMKDLF